MDKEIAVLRESIATTKANEKLLKANLTAVNATVSTDDLRSQITRLDMERSETLGRLGPLRVRQILSTAQCKPECGHAEPPKVRQRETSIGREKGRDGEDMETVVKEGRFEKANLHGYVGLLY